MVLYCLVHSIFNCHCYCIAHIHKWQRQYVHVTCVHQYTIIRTPIQHSHCLVCAVHSVKEGYAGYNSSEGLHVESGQDAEAMGR